MRSMVFRILGDVHIVVAGSEPPTNQDWDRYLEAVRAEEKKLADFRNMRTLVFSDGGGPNAAQRKAVSEFLKGRTTPVAIITGSTIMRGIVTALAWFNPETKAFAPDDVGSALAFLKIPAVQHEKIWVELRKLRVELGNPNLKAIREDQKLAGR
jgi:hypothetical protein